MDGVLEWLLVMVFVVGEVLVAGADAVIYGLRVWLLLLLSGGSGGGGGVDRGNGVPMA